jgi:hypothetical protein
MNDYNLTEEDIKLRYITPAIEPKWGHDRMRIASTLMVLPPLAEQNRIVAKVEELLSELE